MLVFVSALTFVVACLAVGLGLFVTAEAVRQLRRQPVAVTARDAFTAATGLLIAAAAGGYWMSLAVR